MYVLCLIQLFPAAHYELIKCAAYGPSHCWLDGFMTSFCDGFSDGSYVVVGSWTKKESGNKDRGLSSVTKNLCECENFELIFKGYLLTGSVGFDFQMLLYFMM